MLYAEGYRGLHTSVNIRQGEKILSIPIEVAISDERFTPTDFGKAIEKAGILPNNWKPAIYTALLALDVLTNESSSLKPWADILPINSPSSPFFYTEEERHWLKGSKCLCIIS